MSKKYSHYSCYLDEGKGIFAVVHTISLLYACTTLVLLIWSRDGRRKTAVYLINLLSSSALLAVAGFSTEKMSYPYSVS